MRFCFKKIKAFAILVCAFISFVAFGCGFGMLYKTAAENVVTEIANPGFETLAGNMPADWTTWVALNEKDESIANVTFSVVNGSDAHNGNALKCVNKSGDSMIRGVVNSAEFKVAGGKTYLLSFYYRSDSSTAVNSLCIRQFKSDGNGTKNTYLWVDTATVAGATDGYRQVSAAFTTDSDAAKAMLQLDIAPTGENAVFYDDFSIEKLDNIEFNGGFERFGGMETPLGWTMSNGSDFSFSDEIYYDGKIRRTSCVKITFLRSR